MKKVGVIDLGELIKSFWKASQEEVEYNEAENVKIDLSDIDTKIWDEANNNIKQIEINFLKNEKENKNKARKNQITKTSVKSKGYPDKENNVNTRRQTEKEIGEE